MTTFNRKDTVRCGTVSKNLVFIKMKIFMLSFCWVFLRLRASFFKSRKPVLTLQTGAPLCLRQIWGFVISSGQREQQLME